MSRSRVLLAGLLLLVVPLSVGAQDGGQDGSIDDLRNLEADTVTFYGHVFGHGMVNAGPFSGPMPANTEAPIGEDNYGVGTGNHCASGPTEAASGVGAPFAGTYTGSCEDSGWNKLALFSTAGFVQVENRVQFDQNGRYALLHNERGQTQPIVLDTGESITARVFASMDSHGWAVGNGWGTSCLAPHPPNVPCLYPYWGWDPGVYENVVVEATLYHADLGDKTNASESPPVNDAIENGEATLIAQGQWGPDQVMNGLPGAPNVNGFDIDLGKPQIEVIPPSDDFFIVYSIFQEINGQDVLLDGPIRWWAGEFFAPTFTLPVKNAFSVERVIPNFAHGKLAILGVMNTPWGSYDIDSKSVELEIDGPNGKVRPQHIDRFGDFSVAHGGHFKPINLTWIWDYRADSVPSGEYTVTLSASNFQHSASAECSASFELRNEGATLAPGPVEEGVCGFQTASDALLQEIQAGAQEEAG